MDGRKTYDSNTKGHLDSRIALINPEMGADVTKRGRGEIVSSFRGACKGMSVGLIGLDIHQKKLELSPDIAIGGVNGEQVGCRDRKVVVNFGIGPPRSTSEGCSFPVNIRSLLHKCQS